MSRAELLEENIIHEFDHDLVRANLNGCYGKLAGMFYESVFPDILGRRVLDVGCGFGLFSHQLRMAGLQVHSIDVDEDSLAIARQEFQLDCRLESVYETSLADNSIDTIVFNDVICHLEFPRLQSEIARLGARRLIVFDSNISNPLLTSYRRMAGHEEHQDFTLAQVVEHLGKLDFRVVRRAYVNYLSLPISGGLQRQPIPVLHRFPRAIRFCDRLLEGILPWTGLSRFLAFRYLAVFDNAARRA